MSHHEPHHHDHDHPHQPGHSHHHPHEPSTGMSLEEKLVKLLEHWIAHNDEHAKTYRQWSAQARDKGLAATAGLLDEAARMTEKISETFEAAAKTVNPQPK
jgi:hypothetical protein